MFNAIGSLYSNFVGDIHFACMSRLLGYQGIAVVIEELLKIIKSVVSYLRTILRPIYTVRLCRMRQAYDRPTT